MYKTLLIVLIIIILLFTFSKIELFTTNEIVSPNIDTIVINDVVMDKSNFINDKIIDNNYLLITNTNIHAQQEEIKQEEHIQQEEINLSSIMIPHDKFDNYFNEYNIKLFNQNKQEFKNNELDTNISSGLSNTDVTNIYRKYIKRIPSYLNDPDMRSYNIDESKNYSGLMDIGFIKLI